MNDDFNLSPDSLPPKTLDDLQLPQNFQAHGMSVPDTEAGYGMNNTEQEWEGYAVYGDVLLVRFADEDEIESGFRKEGGLFISTGTQKRVWRRAEVLVVGPDVKNTKVGDFIMFEDVKGVPLTNVTIQGFGLIRKARLIPESYSMLKIQKKTK